MKKLMLAIAVMVSSLQPAFAYEAQSQDLRDGDAIIGGIIGGIVGGIIGGVIAADRMERDGYHHRPYHVVCYARNGRGQTFRAFGMGPRRVQNDAMRSCQRWSHFCRPMGCQRGR